MGIHIFVLLPEQLKPYPPLPETWPCTNATPSCSLRHCSFADACPANCGANFLSSRSLLESAWFGSRKKQWLISSARCILLFSYRKKSTVGIHTFSDHCLFSFFGLGGKTEASTVVTTSGMCVWCHTNEIFLSCTTDALLFCKNENKWKHKKCLNMLFLCSLSYCFDEKKPFISPDSPRGGSMPLSVLSQVTYQNICTGERLRANKQLDEEQTRPAVHTGIFPYSVYTCSRQETLFKKNQY